MLLPKALLFLLLTKIQRKMKIPMRRRKKLRTEQNQPTIQEELKAVADRAKKPQLEVTDSGELTREELREMLMNVKVIAKRK